MKKASTLLRYSGGNFASLALPLAVGLATIPYLIEKIGIEKFGVLSIIWALVGYFSLFDFGLSKALTKRLAEGRSDSDHPKQRQVFWTAMFLMLVLGITGWLILAFVVNVAGGAFLKVSENLLHEVEHAILLIAAFIPLVVISAGLRGCMEAYEEFRAANLIRLSLGIWMFLAPAIASGLGLNSLILLAAVVIVGRLIAAITSWHFVSKALHGLGKPTFSKKLVGPLFSFGGWVTLSGILSPLMSYADRFIIGSIVGASGVAYYTTPQDIATKLLLLPIAINTALFPLLSRELAQTNNSTHKAQQLITKSMAYALMGILPFSLTLISFANELMGVWLGHDFAINSGPLLQLFAIGISASAVGIILIPVLFASNQPAALAKLYIVELPVFLIASIYLAKNHGVMGAAFAWMMRSVFDAALIWQLTSRVRHEIRAIARPVFLLLAISTAIAYLAGMQNNLTLKATICLISIICAVTTGYLGLLRHTNSAKTQTI